MQPFDKDTLQQFEAGYQAYRKTLGPSKQQVALQKKQQGNIFTHLLPTIGGTGGGVAGGTIGGAVAGTAILPGIGTIAGGLIGALAGGAAGGAGGKVVENHLEGKSLGSGVAGQAAEQGVLSAGPLRLLKGATLGVKAGTAAAREGEGLAGAINAAATRANTPLVQTQLAKTGGALRGEARGIKPGVTQTGTSQRLKPAQSDDINNYLNSIGTKNSAHTQVRAVANDLKASGSEIDRLLKTHDRPTTVQELSTITEAAGAKAKNAIGFNPNDQMLSDVNGQLSQAHNLSDLRNVRSNIDDQLKSFYSKGERNTTTTTAVENVLKGYRDGIDKVLTKSIPGFKAANTRYATGLKAQDLLLKSSNPQGIKLLGVQTGLGGEGLQATKDLAGRGLGKLGGNPAQAGANSFGAKAIASRTVPTGVLQASAALQQQPPVQDQATDPTQQTGDLTSAVMNAQDPSLQQQPQEVSPYSREALVSDIQRDPKNASKYIDTYNSLQDIYAPPDASKGYNTTASGVIADTKTGLNSLQQLYGQLSTNNANDPVIGKLRSLNPLDTNAKTLNQQIATTKQIVGKALEGGVLRKEDEAKYAAILPTINDTDEVAKQKIQYLYNQIAGRLQIFQDSLGSGGGSSNDLTNALMQSGYAQ